MAHSYREFEGLLRRKGAGIQLADNRSRPKDEGDPVARSSSTTKGTDGRVGEGEARKE